MSKTTIELSRDLTKRAKALAARRGTTLRALVEEGLRIVIREGQRARPFKSRDASVGGKGLQREFRDADWERIRNAAYDGRGS